jgi:cytochrome P450
VASFQGRPLTHQEKLGYANIAFAGGRDTIIHTIACALGHLAANPEALTFLREDPKRITHASEEFFRFFMPLTHIGRVCPVTTSVHGEQVPAGGRVSLGWASANRDETVFAQADEFKIDRKPNPHLSFGFGEHLCLGAPHARLILRTLLQKCVELVGTLEIISSVERVEKEPSYERTLGYESLVLRIRPQA